MSSCSVSRHSRGFSLIEILLVIGIIAVLALAAFVIYPKVQSTMRAQEAAKGIQASLANIRGLSGPRNDHAWVSPSTSHQFFPDAWVFPNGSNPPVIRIPSTNGRPNMWVYGSSSTGVRGGSPGPGQRGYLMLDVYGLSGPEVDTEFCIKFITALAPQFTLINTTGGAPGNTLLDKENPVLNRRVMELDKQAVIARCQPRSSWEQVRFVGR